MFGFYTTVTIVLSALTIYSVSHAPSNVASVVAVAPLISAK